MREDGFLERDVLQAIHVAFICLQQQPDLRPPMSQIVSMLTCNANMNGTPTRPAFLERRRKRDIENPSCDSISDPFPSPLQSDSSLPKHPPNWIMISIYIGWGTRGTCHTLQHLENRSFLVFLMVRVSHRSVFPMFIASFVASQLNSRIID